MGGGVVELGNGKNLYDEEAILPDGKDGGRG